MRKYWLIFVLFLFSLIAESCITSQDLLFEVLVEETSFKDPGPKAENGFMIIASLDEIGSPTPRGNFPESMKKILKQVDFDKSFILLHFVGNLQNSRKIISIYRRGNSVHVLMKPYNPGPGNYMIPGFTPPFQITSIEKIGKWNKKIHFIFEFESVENPIFMDHFIP